MRLESIYNEPFTLEKGDKIAFGEERHKGHKGYLFAIYKNWLLVSTGRVNESELEDTIYFNLFDSKKNCREEIADLNWRVYNPK